MSKLKKIRDILFSKKAVAPAISRRAYHAGAHTRLTMGLQNSVRPIDVDIRQSLKTVVARCRAEAQNNDYIRRFLGLSKSNIIGSTGITLCGRVKDEDGTNDKDANKAIEEGWSEFCEYGVPEITGCYSMKSMMDIHVDSLMRDGEILFLIQPGYAGNRYRFVVQLMDTMVLDPDYNRDDLQNGHVIRMGVELNATRRPVAYHMLTTSVGSDDYYSFAGKKYIRHEAKFVVHRFFREFIWQTRGVPPMASGLLRANMLHGYEEAALVNAREGANKLGFITTPDGALPGLDDDTSEDAVDANGNLIAGSEPGEWMVLKEGQVPHTYDPTYPLGEFGPFCKEILRGLGAGLGVSYHTFANDLEGVNYSSGRLGAMEDRELWKALQRWYIDHVLSAIYGPWIDSSVLAGAIKINGRPLRVLDIDRYRKVFWQARRWDAVDPQKQSNANKTDIDEGLKSRSEIIRDSGRDPEEVWTEIQTENELLSSLGIKVGAAKEVAAVTETSDDKGDTDE